MTVKPWMNGYKETRRVYQSHGCKPNSCTQELGKPVVQGLLKDFKEIVIFDEKYYTLYKLVRSVACPGRVLSLSI
jgi:hypothetical protein